MRTLGRTVALAMLRDYQERGKRIRLFRKARHLTQKEAADLAGVTEKTWRSWEAGSGMKAANVRAAAEALNVSEEQIDGQADIPNPFSLAAHLDENVEVFREFCYEMRDNFERVEATVDGLAAALVAAGVIQRESWHRGVEEAAELLREGRAADVPPAIRTERRGTG